MKIAIRLAILFSILSGSSALTVDAYAITSSAAGASVQTQERTFAVRRYEKRKRTFERKASQKDVFNVNGPQELFLRGLLLGGIGGMLLLGAKNTKTATIGDALSVILMSVTGAAMLAAGALVIIIAGIWWLTQALRKRKKARHS